jgi:HK97 family phage major capsid protein
MTKEYVDAIREIAANTGEALQSHKSALEDITARLEAVEAVGDRPRAGNYSRTDNDHKTAFTDWLRKPRDGMAKRRLEEAEHEAKKSAYGTKAVTVGTGSSGGFAVPTEIDNEIESRVRILNPFRGLVRNVRVGTTDYRQLLSKNNADSGWVGEGDPRAETRTSDLVKCEPTFGFVYAYPKASEESMQDIFFDVGAWLVEEVSDAFAAAETVAIVSGNGTSKPTGFLNATPVATDDDASPQRGDTALEYLPLTSSPIAINADDLIELSLSIKERYLLDGRSVAFAMRRSTAAIVRKLKDSNGQYLWQPSIQAGVPNMLLGYPVALTDAMPAATSNQFPIAFGNWRRAYLLADRSGIEVTTDSNITTPGQVKLYVRRRVGGKVLNNQSVKLLKVAAT